jgi:[NiFe] hydrogenase diaphorase moiety large subunit
MTSPNPILTTLRTSRWSIRRLVKPSKDRMRATFDIQSAIDGARKLAKRRSYIYDKDFSQ